MNCSVVSQSQSRVFPFAGAPSGGQSRAGRSASADHLVRVCVALAVLALWLNASRGDLIAEEHPYQFSLLANATPAGWSLIAGQFSVESERTVLQGGTKLARTDYRFTDFVLELEYQLCGAGDIQARIYYRSEAAPSADRIAGPYVGFTQSPPRRGRLRRAARRPAAMRTGPWNQLRLVALGDRVSVHINGRLRKTIRCRGRAGGHIALAAIGDPRSHVAFRQVSITELDHRALFNGHDLTGWEGADDDADLCWKVEDGLLLCNGKKGPWLRSRQEFGDFNLRLEYRLQEGGNSGVYVRVPKDGRHHGEGAGIEVQILDDAATRYQKLKPYQFSASLYAIAAADPRVGRPAGQWNSLEINCRGTRYTITHNGHVVLDTSDGEFPEIGRRRLSGFLGLQNHSESVWFRNLRIGPPR